MDSVLEEGKVATTAEVASNDKATAAKPIEAVSGHDNEEFAIDFDSASEFDEFDSGPTRTRYEDFPEVELDSEAIAKEEVVQQYIAANQDAMAQAMATWKNTLAERKHLAFICSKEGQADTANNKEANGSGQAEGAGTQVGMSRTITVPCIGQCKHVSFSAGVQAKTVKNEKEEIHESGDEDDDDSDTASMRMIATALSIRRKKGAARSVTVQARTVADTEENEGDETLIADEIEDSEYTDEETEYTAIIVEAGAEVDAEVAAAEDTESTTPDKTASLQNGKSVTSEEVDNVEDAQSSASEEIVKKPFNKAWIPMSRFNRQHPNPIIIKPAKPLFSSTFGMSKTERNIWLTDLLVSMEARIDAQEAEDKRGQELKKEIEAVMKELDCVSAQQEYISLLVQMFKDEPEKLTDEFRGVIESRLRTIDEDDRAAKERSAKLEVEWEKMLAEGA